MDGHRVSTDAGCLLVGELDRSFGITERFARCFNDRRNPDLIEHDLLTLMRQRVYGLAAGYEDLNDHDFLRVDPLLAAACGQDDVFGEQRRREEDRGKGLAGKSTFNRVELGAGLQSDDRYKRIQADLEQIEDFFIEEFVRSVKKRSPLVILDIDTSCAPRRVVCKAECTLEGENPRFVITNLPAKGYPMQELYEQTYCARGDMENRIKEQFLDLKAGRISTHYVRSNQLRMAFSAVAYLLMHHLRSRALKGTEMETATCGTIRQKLLKVGAVVKLSCRRLLVSLSAAYPFQDLWKLAASRILRFGFG